MKIGSRPTPPTPSVTAWWTFIDQRGSAASMSVDHREVPERPSDVEGFAGLLPGQVEEVGQGSRRGQLDPPEVVVEVQVTDIDPSRNTHPPRPDPLAQPGE